MIFPKRKNMIDGVEQMIISLYAKEMTNSDFEISTTSISLILGIKSTMISQLGKTVL